MLTGAVALSQVITYIANMLRNKWQGSQADDMDEFIHEGARMVSQVTNLPYNMIKDKFSEIANGIIKESTALAIPYPPPVDHRDQGEVLLSWVQSARQPRVTTLYKVIERYQAFIVELKGKKWSPPYPAQSPPLAQVAPPPLPLPSSSVHGIRPGNDTISHDITKMFQGRSSFPGNDTISQHIGKIIQGSSSSSSGKELNVYRHPITFTHNHKVETSENSALQLLMLIGFIYCAIWSIAFMYNYSTIKIHRALRAIKEDPGKLFGYVRKAFSRSRTSRGGSAVITVLGNTNTNTNTNKNSNKNNSSRIVPSIMGRMSSETSTITNSSTITTSTTNRNSHDRKRKRNNSGDSAGPSSAEESRQRNNKPAVGSRLDQLIQRLRDNRKKTRKDPKTKKKMDARVLEQIQATLQRRNGEHPSMSDILVDAAMDAIYKAVLDPSTSSSHSDQVEASVTEIIEALVNEISEEDKAAKVRVASRVGSSLRSLREHARVGGDQQLLYFTMLLVTNLFGKWEERYLDLMLGKIGDPSFAQTVRDVRDAMRASIANDRQRSRQVPLEPQQQARQGEEEDALVGTVISKIRQGVLEDRKSKREILAGLDTTIVELGQKLNNHDHHIGELQSLHKKKAAVALGAAIRDMRRDIRQKHIPAERKKETFERTDGLLSELVMNIISRWAVFYQRLMLAELSDRQFAEHIRRRLVSSNNPSNNRGQASATSTSRVNAEQQTNATSLHDHLTNQDDQLVRQTENTHGKQSRLMAEIESLRRELRDQKETIEYLEANRDQKMEALEAAWEHIGELEKALATLQRANQKSINQRPTKLKIH
jgi:23S rRNA maturation mini-RNase III